MSGYAEHLLFLLIKQRESLALTAAHLHSLGPLNNLLAALSEARDLSLPPQIEALRWARTQKVRCTLFGNSRTADSPTHPNHCRFGTIKSQRILSQLVMTLLQASVLCEALGSPKGALDEMTRQLASARAAEKDLDLAFAWHPEPQRFLYDEHGDKDDEVLFPFLSSSSSSSSCCCCCCC